MEAMIHDYLCDTAKSVDDFKYSDTIFLELLKYDFRNDVHRKFSIKLRAYIFYYAVRLHHTILCKRNQDCSQLK
jgi:hypothetical protein